MRWGAFALALGVIVLAGCGSAHTVTVTGSPRGTKGGGSSSGGCAISYEDIEISLSSGVLTCSQVAQQRAGLGELWKSGGITNSSGLDPRQTDCTLLQNGQTATISYGTSLGDKTQADLICSDFVSAGWTQTTSPAVTPPPATSTSQTTTTATIPEIVCPIDPKHE